MRTHCDFGCAEANNCVVGGIRCERCGTGCKATCIDRCAIEWAQMPYAEEEGGAK